MQLETFQEIRTDRYKLMAGQIASDIDQAIPMRVLHDIIEPNQHVCTIKDMQLAIADFADVFQVTMMCTAQRVYTTIRTYAERATG